MAVNKLRYSFSTQLDLLYAEEESVWAPQEEVLRLIPHLYSGTLMRAEV